MANEEIQEETKGKEEKTPTEEDKGEEKQEKSDEGKLVKEAKETAQALKNENDRRERILKEEKSLLDRKEALLELGGSSYAGIPPPKPKEDSPLEYAEKALKGDFN